MFQRETMQTSSFLRKKDKVSIGVIRIRNDTGPVW